ncbi:hypothetical protein GCM10023201_46080 [Actinomycetospora corticicola]|uniref:SUKH-3 immunity protein of toxin-antitoxin system n=1 Tax=Actinomycetospora corticicola TaxID=663602 RepID=A0A7Y9E0T5_9PSEU|nr:hypothetical protein [Actinomycetospora corticicola]
MTPDEAVARVIAAQRSAGETVQPGADADRIATARAALRAEFGAELPEACAALLRRCDGLDHDGLVLYGSAPTRAAPGPGGFWQGLVEMNRLWREAPGRDDVLVLGETDLDLVVVALDGGSPALRDKVGGDVVETFPDVGSALVRLFSAST